MIVSYIRFVSELKKKRNGKKTNERERERGGMTNFNGVSREQESELVLRKIEVVVLRGNISEKEKVDSES